MTTKADKSLTLLRHAKSSWTNAHLSDHERPLNDRGKRDAPEMAKRLLNRSCIPDLIYTSSAARALETASLVSEGLRIPDTHIHVFDRLYLATAESILSVIAQAESSDVRHLLVIGHNPGMENLGRYLSAAAMAQLPTAGLYHFDCSSFELMTDRDVASSKSGSNRHGAHGQQVDTHKRAHRNTKLKFQDFPKNR